MTPREPRFRVVPRFEPAPAARDAKNQPPVAPGRIVIRLRTIGKWVAASLLIVLLAGYFVLAHFMGGPRDVYDFLRYALPHWREGSVRLGDRAPDARLVSLDGKTSFYLHDFIGKRPLVLIFGSYT